MSQKLTDSDSIVKKSISDLSELYEQPNREQVTASLQYNGTFDAVKIYNSHYVDDGHGQTLVDAIDIVDSNVDDEEIKKYDDEILEYCYEALFTLQVKTGAYLTAQKTNVIRVEDADGDWYDVRLWY